METSGRAKKTKTAISIDGKLLEGVRELAKAAEFPGGVSGVIETCVRRWLMPMKCMHAPEKVSRLEELQMRVAEYRWRSEFEEVTGRGDADYGEEIYNLQVEIAEEERERALERAIEEKMRSEEERTKKRKGAKDGQ